MTTITERLCWCGESRLVDFSDEYRRCLHCGTLVSQAGLQPEDLLVRDDNQDFYGKEYWLSHQREDLANPDIFQRVRADLPERDLYWLRTLLAHKQPPGRVLELGSAHGGFVALMCWAGFDAVGQEMSPWVVDFAKQTFDVPMLVGPIEQQQLSDASFDAIVLYDVLEHLDNPLSTMRRCVELLKPNGIIIIQTPCYPEEKTYADLLEQRDPFLAHIDKKANQHLYLFSERAAQELFKQLAMNQMAFKPALFGYDMYFVASKAPLPTADAEQVTEVLARSPTGRLIQALIDLDDRVRALQQANQDIERDRLSRLEMIAKLNQHIQSASADYEARLKVILEQQAQLAQFNQQLAQLNQGMQQAAESLRERQATIDQQSAALEQINGNFFVRVLKFLHLLPRATNDIATSG